MSTLDRISQHTFLPALLRENSVVFDLGGNRGAFSRGVRDKYGLRVVAVEPTPELAETLRQQGFEVLQAAITGRDGTTSFTYDPAQELTGSVLNTEVVESLKDRGTTIEVPARSLDSLLKGHIVDLVKVDIEGAELQMFAEASDEALLSVRQFTVEFHDFWYPQLRAKTEAIHRRLRGLGFWMMRGTPNNKDVLFVHPSHKPSFLRRAYIALWLRNIHGAKRALALFLRWFVGPSRNTRTKSNRPN